MVLLSSEEPPVILSNGALKEPWAFVPRQLSLHGTMTLQRAWGNCGAGGGNFSVCASEWKPGRTNTYRENGGLENILFMCICSKFLFVLHPFITCVFPYCLFGSANQVKHGSVDLIFHSLSSYTGRTRVIVAKRTILADKITRFTLFWLVDCRNGILGPALHHVIAVRPA